MSVIYLGLGYATVANISSECQQLPCRSEFEFNFKALKNKTLFSLTRWYPIWFVKDAFMSTKRVLFGDFEKKIPLLCCTGGSWGQQWEVGDM